MGEVVQLDPEELLHRGRADNRSKGRALLCKWLVEDLKHSQVEISKELGMTRAAVGDLVKRGRQIEKDMGVFL